MSVASWKREFYTQCAVEVPKEDALLHSLTKWRGFLPEALAKHECYIEDGRLKGDDYGILAVDSKTCALCHCYLRDTSTNFSECPACPLVSVRGVRCDEADEDGCESPYHMFTLQDNPAPMLKLLEEAYKRSKASDTRP